MQRRFFLKGLGGTLVALPYMESILLDPKAKAADSNRSFAIFVYQPMGPEKGSWWPKATGALTRDSISGRGLEPLGDYLDKCLIVRGLGHGLINKANSGDHGEAIASTLTGARVDFPGNQEWIAKAKAASLDHVIARYYNSDSLNLVVPPKSDGPVLSWAGSDSRNQPEYNPLTIYKRLFPNGEGSSTKPQVDDKAALRKGVNDLIRSQVKTILANPRISDADKKRFELHLQNIRDLENQILTAVEMPESNRKSIQGFSGNAQDKNMRSVTPKMHSDILAIAAATGMRRAMTLQLGPFTLDSEYDDNGLYVKDGFHDQASHANKIDTLKKVDRLNQKDFAYLLKALSQYKFEDNGKSLLDYGITTFVISLGLGANHSRYDLPHITAGSANGKLAQGKYIDLLPGVTNDSERSQKRIPINRLLSTIGSALAIPGTENFNAGNEKTSGGVALAGNLPQILA